MLEAEDNILKLTYDDELEAVIMAWSGFSSSAVFREANENVLRLIHQKNASKMIADLREMRIIKLDDQDWLYNNWLPRVTDAGMENIAIIESEDYFNRLTVDNITQKLKGLLTVKYFNTYLSARNWIRNQ